jgi:hypothetical protein
VLTLPASRAQQAEVAERRARALTMRAAQVPLSAIAAQLGYSSAAAVSVDIRRAMDRRRDELRAAADALAALEDEKLDTLERGMWAVFHRRHILVSQGHVMRDEEGRPLLDDDPATRAAAILLRAFERRSKLHGLDAPTKVTAKVEVQDELDADIERLAAELARTPGPAVEREAPAPGGGTGASAGAGC